ncbi:MAG: hypothetical protein ACP5N7_02860 [Candidatus Pacearchaeota archaeon]
MSYSRSPKSNNRTLTKIDLPDEIKAHYSKRRKFIRGLPSYQQIEGINPEDHSGSFDYTYGFPIPKEETRLVNNTSPEDYKSAQQQTIDLLHLFFATPQSHVAEPVREYMLTGGTKPIRVSTHLKEGGNKFGKRVYVKLPSVERIIGLSLYNLISGKYPVDFLFSEYVFIEDSVPGRHIDRDNIQYFQRLQNLPYSLVRLAVQDKFLGLHDLDRTVDLPGKRSSLVNLLVQSEGEVVAFDVDCAFTTAEVRYSLVDKAREQGIIIPEAVEKNISREEARRIMHIINVVSPKPYQRFISLIDKIALLREQFERIGFKEANKYFREREKWLKSMAK